MSYETDLIDAMYDLDMIVRVYARKSGAYADEVAVLSYSSAYVQSLIGRIMSERCGQKVSIARIKLRIQDILSKIDALCAIEYDAVRDAG
jgi:hypothetical protein